nr:tetratricopeptide repeat protein [uncultured Capnocytophaga sp.]
MKKPLLIASALLFAAVAFGQKKELKEIEKQIRKGELPAAQTGLNAIKGSIDGTEFAPQFYFLEGELNIAFAKKNTRTAASLQAATEAFAKVRQLEGGKGKYSGQIPALANEAVNIAITEAQNSYDKQLYKNAAIAFEQVYRLSPRDTAFLYNAAVVSVQNKDYDNAVRIYKELKDLRYDGSEKVYYATDKQTKKEVAFGDKNQRDLMVKAKTHERPRDEKTPSKRADIVKNIAYIYVEQGKNEEALKAFEEARKSYPKDANIILNQANIYLQLGDKEKFKELMAEAAQIEPNNPDLHYNMGVINMEQKNIADSRKNFEQALRIKPNYPDAALNLSTTYLEEGNALVEQMNKLGTSKADNEKFDKLRGEKDELFKKGASILEDFIKVHGNTDNILEQLKIIYGALGDTSNFQRIKKMLDK